MPTYEAVQREVKMTAGFVPKTCWIAHVLELHGRTLRTAPNRLMPTPENIPVHSKSRMRSSKPFASWKGEASNLIGVLYDNRDCHQPRD